ncbi:hypothetical protein KKE60_04565, partial [Patescibacteria group bacterium]|nr:hypothetical protein [Patescibacteria group bacterium]
HCIEDDGPVLTSMMFRRSSWKDGKYVASCEQKEKHTPPHESCNCGIHALKHIENLVEISDFSSLSSGSRIAGSVALHGKVIEGERGYRAGFADVLAIFNFSTNARSIAEKLRVDLVKPPQELLLALSSRNNVAVHIITSEGIKYMPLVIEPMTNVVVKDGISSVMFGNNTMSPVNIIPASYLSEYSSVSFNDVQ